MSRLPNQRQSALPAGRQGNNPPSRLVGVQTTEATRVARERVSTRLPRPEPVPPKVPAGWITRLVEWGSELVAQKVAKILIDQGRATEFFVRNPAHLQPTSDGEIYDQDGRDIALPNVGAAGGPYTTICQYTVPPRNMAVIAFIGNDLSNVGAWNNVNWRLRIDNNAVSGYNNRLGQMGAMNAPFSVPNGFIAVATSRSIVRLEARNNGFPVGGFGLFGFGRLGGWQWILSHKSSTPFENGLKD